MIRVPIVRAMALSKSAAASAASDAWPHKPMLPAWLLETPAENGARLYARGELDLARVAREGEAKVFYATQVDIEVPPRKRSEERQPGLNPGT